MTLSPQQSSARDAVARWLRDRHQPVYRLFGYAGSGKSTIARQLAAGVDGRVVYGAYTGKAALVMRRNGCPDATTLHSMLYKARTDDRGHTTWTVDRDGPAAKANLILVDEVSMIGDEMGNDLVSLGVPILVLGDPEQLPPIGPGANGGSGGSRAGGRGGSGSGGGPRSPDAGGFFTRGRPDTMLTEIHRQARDNPIVALATDVREGRRLTPGTYGESRVVRRADADPAELQRDVLAAGQVLVGRNKTRAAFNARIRSLRGMVGELPVAGDKLVCLKNNHGKGLLNGGIWRVHEAVKRAGGGGGRADGRSAGEMEMLVDSEDFDGVTRKAVTVPREFFTGGEKELDWRYLRDVDQMTYGEALTVHKGQGSQWPRVVLFDESDVFREEARRWLYSGITRASEAITVVAA